jgi:hypothetical protein
VDRLPVQLAHRANDTRLVHDEGIDRGEIDRDHVVARGARVRGERTMRLRTALIAEVDLRLLVAHEDRARGSELWREPAEHGALGHGEQPRARAGELEHHRCPVLPIDPLDDLSEPTPEELERDVAHAHEGPHPAREQDLHAAGRTEPEGPRRQDLANLRGRRDQGEHPGTPHRGDAGVVGDGEARRRGEPLQVDRRRKADAWTGHEDPVAEGVAKPRRLWLVRGGHADRVVNDGHLDRGLLHSETFRLGHGPIGLAGKDHLVDLEMDQITP